MRIAIAHLDLGIGGAERLVVDVAWSLKTMGHDISILTSHHDHSHCFEETTGALMDFIQVRGDWLPRRLFFGRFTALCSIVRMLYLVIMLLTMRNFDVVFLDGISAPIFILRWFRIPVVFYCHFPDKLLCVDRASWYKRLYRYVLDYIEEISMGQASLIAVNSSFTAKALLETFPRISFFSPPSIIHPTIQVDTSSGRTYTRIKDSDLHFAFYTRGYDFVFISLNRYERKKKIELALEALSELKSRLSFGKEYCKSFCGREMNTVLSGKLFDVQTASYAATIDHSDDGKDIILKSEHEFKRLFDEGYFDFDEHKMQRSDDLNKLPKILLVVAGGYDEVVRENVEYLSELQLIAEGLGLTHTRCMQQKDDNGIWQDTIDAKFDVVFRTSISNAERRELMQVASALLYTPDREHFGIVPLEAMNECVPVIAVNSGGPVETVCDGVTGFLRPQQPEAFAAAMLNFLFPLDFDYAKFSATKDINLSLLTTSVLDRSASRRLDISRVMGFFGRRHVQENFTETSMRSKLSAAFETAVLVSVPASSRDIKTVASDIVAGHRRRMLYYSFAANSIFCMMCFCVLVAIFAIAASIPPLS